MRKVPIKFRGVDAKTGEMIYGSYHYEKCDDGSIVEGIIPEWNPNIEIEIKPDSVAQLVGYDKNGEEVYEGDTVINEQILMGGKLYVKEHVAHYNGCATAEDGCYLVTRQIAAYTHLKK